MYYYLEHNKQLKHTDSAEPQVLVLLKHYLLTLLYELELELEVFIIEKLLDSHSLINESRKCFLP